MKRFRFALIFLIPNLALAAADLMQVRSTYLADDRKTEVTVQGTGTPTVFYAPDPVTGKPKRYQAVFTSSHVSGGKDSTIEVRLKNGTPAKVVNHCSDAGHDLDMLVVEAPSMRSMGTYSASSRLFESEWQELNNWDFDNPRFTPGGDEMVEAIVGLWNWFTKQGKTIRADERGLGSYSGFDQVLVPKWIDYRPSRARRQLIVGQSYEALSADTLRAQQDEQTAVRETLFGAELKSSALVVPGMSGTALIGEKFRFGDSAGGANRRYIRGITSRVMRYNPRSYFASHEVMANLVDRFKAGTCSSATKKTVWHYKISEQGEGLTYRVFQTPLGEIEEINPTFARAGTVISQYVENGGGGSSDGHLKAGAESSFVGGGGSNDGGNRATTKNLIRRGGVNRITIGYDLKDGSTLNDPRQDNPWQRLRIYPGLQVAGKPVLAFRITQRRTGKPPQSVVAYADPDIIDLIQKQPKDYTIEPLEVPQSMISLLKERMRVTPNSECFDLRSNAYVFERANRPPTHELNQSIRVENGKIRFSIKAEKETLSFVLDSTGILEGSSNRYFVPIIWVRGQKSGKPYLVDLTKVFFTDISQVYGPTDPNSSSIPNPHYNSDRSFDERFEFLRSDYESGPVLAIRKEGEAHEIPLGLGKNATPCGARINATCRNPETTPVLPAIEQVIQHLQ